MTSKTTAMKAAMARATAISTGAPSGLRRLIGGGHGGLRVGLHDDGQTVVEHDPDGRAASDRLVVDAARRPLLARDVDGTERLEGPADLADAPGRYAGD